MRHLSRPAGELQKEYKRTTWLFLFAATSGHERTVTLYIEQQPSIWAIVYFTGDSGDPLTTEAYMLHGPDYCNKGKCTREMRQSYISKPYVTACDDDVMKLIASTRGFHCCCGRW